MGSVEKRLRLLETQARAKAAEGMSPFERACAKAQDLATLEEFEELERLSRLVVDRGDERPDPAKDQRFFELWEQMLARVGWGTEAREIRDVLLRQLEGLARGWEAQGRKHSTWTSDREFWMVRTAAVNRLHAIQRGESAITDPGEAARIVALVRAPEATIEGVLCLVGRT